MFLKYQKGGLATEDVRKNIVSDKSITELEKKRLLKAFDQVQDDEANNIKYNLRNDNTFDVTDENGNDVQRGVKNNGLGKALHINKDLSGRKISKLLQYISDKRPDMSNEVSKGSDQPVEPIDNNKLKSFFSKNELVGEKSFPDSSNKSTPKEINVNTASSSSASPLLKEIPKLGSQTVSSKLVSYLAQKPKPKPVESKSEYDTYRKDLDEAETKGKPSSTVNKLITKINNEKDWSTTQPKHPIVKKEMHGTKEVAQDISNLFKKISSFYKDDRDKFNQQLKERMNRTSPKKDNGGVINNQKVGKFNFKTFKNPVLDDGTGSRVGVDVNKRGLMNQTNTNAAPEKRKVNGFDLLNAGLGVAGAISYATAKRPTMPGYQNFKAQLLNEDGIGSDSRKNLSNQITQETNAASKPVSSDATYNLITKLGANANANSAISNINIQDSQARQQQRLQNNQLQNQENEINFQGQNEWNNRNFENQQQQFNQRREMGAGMVQGAVNYMQNKHADRLQQQENDKERGNKIKELQYTEELRNVLSGKYKDQASKDLAVNSVHKKYGVNPAKVNI